MERFTKLFGSLIVFVYHCFDRIVIHGYLSGLSRPEQVVYFFRQVLGIPVVSKEVLRQRTDDYRGWVEAYARNHKLTMEWAEKGVRKEDRVRPALRRMEKKNAYGVYFIFKSMEQGRTFRIGVPKYPTEDPNYRILTHQRSRFTALLFLRPRRSTWPDCRARGQLLPLPRHLLAQRPLLHGAETEAQADRLPQERQCVSGGGRCRPVTSRRRPT